MRSCGRPSSFRHRDVLILDLDDVDVRDHILRRLRVEAAAGFRIEALDDLDVALQLLDREPELPGQLRHLVVVQQPEMLGHDLLRRRALEVQVLDLQRQAFLQVARGDADRVETLDQAQPFFDLFDRPRPHRRDFVDRRDEIAVVIEVADDRVTNFADRDPRSSAATAATRGDR